MAIRKSFNGASILKPGAYSRFKVDNSAGSDLGANETIFLIGESTKGAPGSVTGIVEYSAARLDALIETYGSGPIVDAAVACVRPSLTPGVGGAGKILVYKTNASTQATGSIVGNTSNLFNIKDAGYGVDGNNISIVIESGSLTDTRIKTISIAEAGGVRTTLGTNGVGAAVTIEYTGDASTAELSISGASRSSMTLSAVLAGDQTDGSANLNLNLADMNMRELVEAINAVSGYVAVLADATKGSSPASDLDPQPAPTAGGPADITSVFDMTTIQADIRDILASSDSLDVTEDLITGDSPDLATITLSGGTQGASANSDFSQALSVSLAEEYSVVLPCVSRDASVDIADSKLGTTDAASTYTISSVRVATTSHLILRGSTKNRKEAQGFIGVREVTKAAAFAAIASSNDLNLQGVMQDCIFLDAQGSLKVGQPHVLAAMMAGIRLGTPIGEPLTYKFLNVQGLGHIIDPDTLLESGDFNSGLDAEEAIENGVTFGERRGAGWRIVLDNTSYGIDESFVFNRGSVVEASYFVFKTLRELAEDFFIGRKVSNGLASSLKNAVRNKLRELNAPDVQIITSSDDAPEGFREATFVVTVNGNTARVQVEFKPVQGLDFVFFDFTLGDIQQTA